MTSMRFKHFSPQSKSSRKWWDSLSSTWPTPLNSFLFSAGSTWCISWVRFSRSSSWPRSEENMLSQRSVFLLILFCSEPHYSTFTGLTREFSQIWSKDWIKMKWCLEKCPILVRTSTSSSSTYMLLTFAACFGGLLSWFSSMLRLDHSLKLLRKCLEILWTSLFYTSFLFSCLPSSVELISFLI